MEQFCGRTDNCSFLVFLQLRYKERYKKQQNAQNQDDHNDHIVWNKEPQVTNNGGFWRHFDAIERGAPLCLRTFLGRHAGQSPDSLGVSKSMQSS